MALSTTSSSTAAGVRVNVGHADLCALVCAASAGIHGALVVPHAEASTRMAVAFASATVALAVATLALVLTPGPATSRAAGGLLGTVATAYLLSRTSGLPGLTAHPEPFDTFGTAVSLVETVAAVVALRHSNPRRHA